jgi:hypothetical protein
MDRRLKIERCFLKKIHEALKSRELIIDPKDNRKYEGKTSKKENDAPDRHVLIFRAIFLVIMGLTLARFV